MYNLKKRFAKEDEIGKYAALLEIVLYFAGINFVT